MVDAILAELSPAFAGIYSGVGRPSIAPEKLLRALLLQALYSIRSERLLMEQLDFNLLFRWFVAWRWTTDLGRDRVHQEPGTPPRRRYRPEVLRPGPGRGREARVALGGALHRRRHAH